MQKVTNAMLPADLKGLFEIPLPLEGGEEFIWPAKPEWGTVNFKKLTIEQADGLIALGFPFLKRVEKQAAAEPKK